MIVKPSQLPSVNPMGQLVPHAGKYAKNAVLVAFDMLGGTDGLVTWAGESAQNKADFYTKIFTKTIQKDIEISDVRSIEDVLEAIDGEFTVVAPETKVKPQELHLPETIHPANGQAPPTIVLGVDEDEETYVE